MTNPTIIINDLSRGKSYYANLIHQEIYDAQIGAKAEDCNKDSQCLLYIIKALQYRIDADKFDDITEKIWRCLVTIIGTYVTPSTVRFYFGSKNDPLHLTESQILASSYIEAPTGSNPIIPFAYDPNIASIFWMAELTTETLKVKWQDTEILFNGGNIGSSTDTFNAPYIAGTVRAYDTNFYTQFSYPIQFLK